MKNIRFLIVILIFISCKTKEDKSAQTIENQEVTTISEQIVLNEDQLKLMNIIIGQAETKAIQGGIVASGKVTVLASDMADISAQFRGTIAAIRAHEGQFVKKGEVIMEMTSPEIINIQKDYLLAQSELLFLEKEWQRQQELAQANVGATKNLQEVQSKVMMQKAIMKTAASTLKLAGIPPPQLDGEIVDKIAIKSPVSGYIDHFPVALGTAVTEGTKLAHVESFDDPHADIAIYERDLQKIKTGQRVKIDFADPAFGEAIGHIEYIGRDIDPASKTVTVHVPFKVPSGKIIATDMVLTAFIESQSTPSVALPESAVIQEDNQFYCFIVENDKDKTLTFKKLAIEPIGMSNGWIGVGDNFKNKKIVVKGANILLGESKKGEGE
jgi:cobalt-zinc-cadmium efflux system membrane fusion protein